MTCCNWEDLHCLVSQWLLRLVAHCLLMKWVPQNVLQLRVCLHCAGYILTGMHVWHALMCCTIMSFAQLALAAHGYTGASRLVEGRTWAFFHKPGNAIIFLLIGDVWILSAFESALGWLSSLGAQ